MVAFADLIQVPTRAQIKAQILSIADAAGLTVTSWVLGDPSERWIEIAARAIDQFLSNITTQGVRGFFLDLATDPGDPGDLSADQTPRPGWLSGLGSGWYGTTRGAATFGTGTVTITNTGSTTSLNIPPGGLTFRRIAAATNGGYPTYRNTIGSNYTGVGGTIPPLAPSASFTTSVVAEQSGTYGNVAAGSNVTLVTTSYGTFSVTNGSIIGQDREAVSLYVARCRQAANALSPNGPADAYRYACTTGTDGNPLQLYDGSGATTVNRVYVSSSSATGNVTVYMANPSGPATSTEVSTANANMTGILLASSGGTTYMQAPVGVVPDTAILGPTVSDPQTGGPGGAAATATTINVTATCKIKSVPGLSNSSLQTAVQNAAAAALGTYFSNLPIGGLDQTSGAGVVYTSDIQDQIASSYLSSSGTQLLYAVTISAPSGATTAIALGHVPVLGTTTITVTVT